MLQVEMEYLETDFRSFLKVPALKQNPLVYILTFFLGS